MKIITCIAVALMVTSSFTLASAKGREASEHQEYMNGGYYLLHHLFDDEAKVSLLLWIKTAPPEIGTYTDHVSKTAEDCITSLDRIQESDDSLQFDKNPLPAIECDTRESIRADKKEQLLFGTTGPAFVQALLIDQISASGYAVNLAKILAQQETDPDRAKTLQHISDKWSAIQKETVRMLRN